MRSINQLSTYLDKWSDDVIKNAVEAQKNSAKKVWEDIKINAPSDSPKYLASIKIGETREENGRIVTTIFTDLNAGWKRHPEVALGAWMEWGTGLLGESSNTYQHGYDYTLTTWWIPGSENEPFEGMIARPHFTPSLLKNRQYYLDQIRKAVKQ